MTGGHASLGARVRGGAAWITSLLLLAVVALDYRLTPVFDTFWLAVALLIPACERLLARREARG